MPPPVSNSTRITAPSAREFWMRRPRLSFCRRRRAPTWGPASRASRPHLPAWKQVYSGRLEINLLEAQLDAEIDAYRDIANVGKPKTAKPLLEALLGRVSASASGRILFR